MNLRGIDLNLLVILDALLDEAHVSRAAQRLNMSQPAVSNALQRCRDLFGDPLLQRGRGGMTRTPKARQLRAPLKTLLSDATDLIDPPEVDLARHRQVLRITAADDPASALAGPLVAALAKTAPGIALVFRPWRGAEATIRDLIDGDTDLVISVFDGEVEGIARKPLITERYVVAMRRGHPAAQGFDLDRWLNWPHVIVSGQGALRTPLDAQLAALGRSRHVALTVPSFHLVTGVLAMTDAIAMLPVHSFAAHAAEDLVAFEPPLPVQGFPLSLLWHARQEHDAGLRHVADLIGAVFDGFTAG